MAEHRVKNKYEYINEHRPTREVSFCGSAVSSIPNYARKLVNNKTFNGIINKVLEKEAVVEAAIVLGLTCTLKPLATLVMPGANKDDKEVLAVKHILSGLVGYGFSKMIYAPISAAANKVKDNPSKYLKGDTEYIKKLAKNGELMERFDVMWKKGPDVLMSIPKSILVTTLIAPTLAFLFPNRGKKKKDKVLVEQQKGAEILNQKLYNNSVPANLSFKGNKVNNIKDNTLNVNNQISFGKNPSKYYEMLTDAMATGMGKLSKTRVAKKIPEALMKFEKPSPRISDLSSIVLTLSLLQNTAKSKTIEKERKPYLLLNTALVTAVSSTASAIVDKSTDGLLESLKKAYMSEKFGFDDKKIQKGLLQLKELKKTGVVSPENLVMSDDQVKALKTFMRGTNKLKSHTIFSFVVRFASPLLVVPLTSAILNLIEKISKKKDAKAQENKTANTTQQAK